MARVKIIWKRSAIGLDERQRRVIEALGLHRLNDSVVHEDSPTVRGMIHKVRHLLALEIAEDGTQGKDQP
jgi:large subunit ribosomal protein L30